MFYQASNPAVSTRDWFSLSFDSVPWALLAERELGEDRDDEPEAPEDDADDATREAYDAAFAAWQEKEDNAGAEPMWSTVFASCDVPAMSAEIRGLGLRVMSDEDLGHFIACDSAGHSFYGSYWIPLRAMVARRQVEHQTPEERIAFAEVLCREYRREGESNVERIWDLLGLTSYESSVVEARLAVRS
jgi:hypothetical protein